MNKGFEKKRLGEILIDEGLITPDQLQRGLQEQHKFGGRIGAILIRLGYISDEKLSDLLRVKLRSRHEDMRRKKLGEILVEEKLLDEHRLKIALQEQRQYGGKLGSVLTRLNYVSEDDIARILSIKLGCKWVALKELLIPDSAVSAVSSQLAKKYFIMPLKTDKKNIIFATNDPTDLKTIDTLGFVLGKKMVPVIATGYDIKWAIARYYDREVLEEERKPLPAPAAAGAPSGTRDTKEELLMSFEGKQIRTTLALEGLIELLVSKGFVTKEEFFMHLYRKDPEG